MTLEFSAEAVPPAEFLEGLLVDMLQSLNESLRMLTVTENLNLTFSENLAATYRVFRSELSILGLMRKHNRSVYKPRHRLVFDVMCELEDELRRDDVFLEPGLDIELSDGASYSTLGRVSGPDDPRAISLVSLLIESMIAWHLLLHADTSVKERIMVFGLWRDRSLRGSSSAKVLTYMLEKRASKQSRSPRQAS